MIDGTMDSVCLQCFHWWHYIRYLTVILRSSGVYIESLQRSAFVLLLSALYPFRDKLYRRPSFTISLYQNTASTGKILFGIHLFSTFDMLRELLGRMSGQSPQM